MAGAPRFVIQEHDATRLHYDLRLEAAGVLVSWAVPKGPSLDPAVRRLAVHVDDHDLAHGDFEGVIPDAPRGSGAVLVWDCGTYRNLTIADDRPVPVPEAVAAGHVSFWLDGAKLTGGWSLTRTGGTQWILVKRSDECADPDEDVTASRPASVVSGRTLSDLASASPSTAGPGASSASASAAGPASVSGGGGGRVAAAWVAPMLATASRVDDPALRAAGTAWRFERKLDGLRCIAVRHGDDVHLWSRNHLSFDRRFPDLLQDLRALPVDDVVLDGEVVAWDGARTSFGLLQQGDGSRAVLCAFDLLHLYGRDTTVLPLHDRVTLLARTLRDAPDSLTVADALDGRPEDLLRRACAEGWEGVVAKRLDQPYRPGRSPGWRKLKCTAGQELVVGGWTDPTGGRTGFGALLVGYHDDAGDLRYAGRVGTGFTEATLRTLRTALDERSCDATPFGDPVPVRGAHWVRPELVAEIAFTEWTRDGRLRHPSWKGLRPDKAAADVRREAQ